MICMSCGRANEQGAQFCKSCGAQLSQSDNSQQGMNNSASDSDVAFKQNNGYQQYDISENVYVGTTRMTKKEFDKCESIKPITKNLMVAAIITYVIGIISFVVNVIVAGNIFGILDVVIVVGLGLGIQLAKSRACAVALGAYSLFNLIFMMILTGRPGGWLIIICAVYAIIYTFKYQKIWNKYQQTGQL